MSFSSLRPRSVGSTKTLPPFEAIVLLFLLLSSPFLLLYSYFYFLFAREICYRQVSNTGRHRDAAMLLRQLWKSNVRPYIAICTILFSGSPPPLSYAQFAKEIRLPLYSTLCTQQLKQNEQKKIQTKMSNSRAHFAYRCQLICRNLSKHWGLFDYMCSVYIRHTVAVH